MVNSNILVATALLLTPFAASRAEDLTTAERLSPEVAGYVQRAREMNENGNFVGVIDQLGHLQTQQVILTPSEAEECAFLLAMAHYGRGDTDCVRLLSGFVASYPASPRAPEAAKAIGDFHFFNHEWPDALTAYDAVDADRLNADTRLQFNYRKALSMIKTGHFREARPLVNSLRGKPGYEDACNFYDAYLDYIEGRFKEAYSRFQRVKPGIPGLDAGYYMTQIEYAWGRYDDVISHGRSLLFKQPVAALAPELNRIVGLSYFKTGNPDTAYGFLSTYLDHTAASPSPDALYALGAIDYGRGDYSLAVERLSPLAEQNDEIGQGALLYLGQCYLQQGNASSAAIAFEKAARLDFDPKVSETALYNYVTAMTRGSKVPFSSASKLLERFVTTYPDSEYTPEVETYLATAYYNDRDFTRALQCIDAIRQPTGQQLATRQKILYELGIEKMTNGDAESAAPYLRQAVELRRYDAALAAQASLWLGDALFTLGRFAEAQKAYEGFTSDRNATENRALAFYDLAYAKYKQKNYRGAASDFAAALAARPGLPENLVNDALIRRGDCLYYTGRYGEAKTQFAKAIENGAIDTDYALYRRALLNGLEGNRAAKLQDLQRVEQEFPGSRWLSKVLLEEAVLHEEAGRKDLAADAYKKRLGVAQDVDLDELLRMAAAMHQAGRSADLLEVTERIRHAGGLEADEMSEIDLYEAEALSALGRNAEADAIYGRLAQTPSSLAGSTAIVLLAESALNRRDYEKARDLMEDFTETGSSHQYWLARGFVALADAHDALGDRSLAREYLLSLRDNYPGRDDIAERIDARLKKWKQ